MYVCLCLSLSFFLPFVPYLPLREKKNVCVCVFVLCMCLRVLVLCMCLRLFFAGADCPRIARRSASSSRCCPSSCATTWTSPSSGPTGKTTSLTNQSSICSRCEPPSFPPLSFLVAWPGPSCLPSHPAPIPAQEDDLYRLLEYDQQWFKFVLLRTRLCQQLDQVPCFLFPVWFSLHSFLLADVLARSWHSSGTEVSFPPQIRTPCTRS